MAAPAIVLNRLTGRSPELETVLPELISLSKTIFPSDPLAPARTSEREGIWRERLEDPTSSIIYLTLASDTSKPVALLCVYPRSHVPPLNIPYTNSSTQGKGAIVGESMHIWLAGVREDVRKHGCLATMMHELDNLEVVTICTFPEKFGNMWRWLTKRGWQVERDFGNGKIQLIRVPSEARLL
jgi:hypothetical protein